MYRKIMSFLEAWKDSVHRKPLILQGARPVSYTHLQAVATLVFDSDIPKNAVSVKAVSPSYELLSNEDLEEIFNF